jgi:hypothetical protein
MDIVFLLKINFAVYCAVFIVCLIKNFNFNIILVGLTYLAPLVPLGITDSNLERFMIVSFCNTIFGIIEVIFFALTEKPEDITFDKAYFQQLWGHVMPIVLALIGMSFFSRSNETPVVMGEGLAIATLFLVGSTLRIWAVADRGARHTVGVVRVPVQNPL